MNSLLPPNATTAEIAVEQTTARLGKIPVEIGKLWNPATCPVELLPWLAWALSVDEWESQWSEQTRREVIKQSAKVHRNKGTRGAVERALRAVGVRIELQEWFENSSAQTPHTFNLTTFANEAQAPASAAVLDPAFFNMVRASVAATKPVRSHYTIRVAAAFDDGIGIYNIFKAGQSVRCAAETQQQPIKASCGINNDGIGIYNIFKAGQSVRCAAETQQQPIKANCGITSAVLLQTVALANFTMEAAA